MKLKDGQLRLSNGKGNEPLVLVWEWKLPQTVVIHWTGVEYEAIATYKQEKPIAQPQGDKVAGVDLGEVHMAVSHDGEHTHILNGRLLRSKRQYRNKVQAKLNSRIDGRMKKGSSRRKKLIKSKQKQLRKLKNQMRDIEHKQTTYLVSTLYQEGVQTVVIGDVRDLRQNVDVGTKNNQKIHQWSHGSVRHMLSYKAERWGMAVVLQEESYTSKTCYQCGHRRKSAVKGRNFVCSQCGFRSHRDGVGSMNIRAKYRGEFGIPHVVAVMAPAISWRYMPHTGVAREQLRENVCVGNCTEAAGL
jgi:putative transposase